MPQSEPQRAAEERPHPVDDPTSETPDTTEPRGTEGEQPPLDIHMSRPPRRPR